MDFPSTQVLDENDDSLSSRSPESLEKTSKRIYQVATLTVGNKKYPIFEGVNKVGRHLDNDICINDYNVSMYHAEIEADAKHAFICDLRSTNKTRMNDEKLKPDRFYQLLDGAKITFGILNGIYLRLRDDESIIIPSTPEPGLKLRKELNMSSSRFHTSSAGDSDDSVVFGTQEIPENIFVKPSVPSRTANIKDTNNDSKIKSIKSNKSIHDEDTQCIYELTEIQSSIHECATQKIDSKQSDGNLTGTKNEQKIKRNIQLEKYDMCDKGTQKFDGKNDDIDESRIPTQKFVNERNRKIYDAETQKISVDRQNDDLDNAMTQKLKTEKIYDVETQKQNKLKNKCEDGNNEHNMVTQRFQPLKIRKEKTEIYDIETQHSTEKLNVSKIQNSSTKRLNAPTQKVEVVIESDGKHKQDNVNVRVNNMVLRSNCGEEVMTTNKKVCINNSTTNNKSNHAFQKRSGLRINKTAVEIIKNSTLISNNERSCLIVAETDDESGTDDEGVFSKFLQKEDSNTICNLNNDDREILNKKIFNNEEILNDRADLSHKNCMSPVLVNFNEISESLRVEKKNNIQDDSDDDTYITPNHMMSPMKLNIHLKPIINGVPRRKLCPDFQTHSYENKNVNQKVIYPLQVQNNEKYKNNILKDTQSMIATQVLIETPKVNFIKSGTNLTETQIIETQVHKGNSCESPDRIEVSKSTIQFIDTQILETQVINDKRNEKNSINNFNNEPTQLIKLKNDATIENILEKQETQVNSELINNDDNNEKLKRLRLKKRQTSNNCIEWRINLSCRNSYHDGSFPQDSQEMSNDQNYDKSSDIEEEINKINDENGYILSKTFDNKDEKNASKISGSKNKINLSLNRSTKNKFENEKEKNRKTFPSNNEDNDVVLKNLDSMFGELTNKEMIEPTQLLTQQLVDILKTPDKFHNSDTLVSNIDKFQKLGARKNVKNAEKKKNKILGNYSSIDEESQELYSAHLNSKRKRKAISDSQDSSDIERSSKYKKKTSDLKKKEPCISGFVDGIAVVCEKIDSKGHEEIMNHEEMNDEIDGILSGLPAVNLNGTNVSPSSHISSLDSSDEDIQSNETKVSKQFQVTLKMSKTKQLVLPLQHDDGDVSNEKTKIATVRLSHYDNKGKLLVSSRKNLQSNEQYEIDQEKIKKTQDSKCVSEKVDIYTKRTASCDLSQSLIESKKKRPVVRLDNSLNISMRQESKRKIFRTPKYCVIFTGINAEDYIEPITNLDGTVTDEPSKATILVTDKVRRTYKFICAISKSIPIVSIKWIDDCIEKDEFLNPDKYILKDEPSEIKFDFELSKSLKKSSEGLLLQGYTFIITPKIVNPSIKDLKDMIQVAGGKSLIRMPRIWASNTVIIGCDADIPKIKEIVKKISKNITVPVVTTEFILSGILKQKLEPEIHRLY